MRLHQHMAVSGFISAGIYAASRSPAMALVSFVAGFMIDLDHLIDYWRAHPFSFNVRHFFATCEGYRLQKLILILHAWEWVFLLGAAAYLTRSAIALGAFLGVTQHLIFDQFTNHVHSKSYFFTYRCLRRFRSEAVFALPPELCERFHGDD